MTDAGQARGKNDSSGQDPSGRAVSLLRFPHYTLGSLLAEIAAQIAQRDSAAWRDLRAIYDPTIAFPSPWQLRLGPSVFADVPLDWLIAFADLASDEASLIGHAIMAEIRWDGDSNSLPDGFQGVVRWSYEQRVKADIAPNTLVGLYVKVEPDFRRSGWSKQLLTQMKALAESRGYRQMIIPTNPPTRYEARYAHLSWPEFLALRRADGQRQDHWLRLHEALGAEVIGYNSRSHRYAMCVADFERLFGDLSSAEDGWQLFDLGGRWERIMVDRAGDLVVVEQGCVWVRYPILPA